MSWLDDEREAARRRDRHLAAVGADAPRVAQSGDRVMVTGGPFAGKVGLVVAIHLVPDEDAHRREAAVLLDATQGIKVQRFTEDQLCILNHPTTEERH